MAVSGVYTFNKDIQRKILSLLWLDPTQWSMYQECIKPRYFEDMVHIDICRIVFDYYEKYDKPPTARIVKQEVDSMLASSKVKQQRAIEYHNELKALRQFDPDDIQYLTDQIVKFAKRQAMSEALTLAADIVVAGKDMSGIEHTISSALGVGEDMNDMGTLMFDADSVKERLERYSSGEDVVERIPTGWPELDKLMYGGLARQEMGIILAPPGRGKTTTFLNIGCGGVRAGKNVLHITFENNEQQTLRNYDCCMLGRDKEFLSDSSNTQKLEKMMLRMCDKSFGYGQLLVKKFNTKSKSVAELKAWIRKRIIQSQGDFVPDVIIVDYGGLIRPDNGNFDKRFQLEGIFEGLKGMAESFDAALWSGAQGNRDSLSKRIVTKADLAEAFNIANIADFMMALCQTEREKSEGKMREFITKQREERDSILLASDINYATKVITIHGEIEQNHSGNDDETYADE